MDPLAHRFNKPSGVLIVEAVVAAFLMIFAFAAASSLFNASLQWESRSNNLRIAAALAERKVGELRAWSLNTHSEASFSSGWPGKTGIHPPYPEAPGFQIEVLTDPPTYRENPTTNRTPDPGMYSPTSHFWDEVASPNPLPLDFPNPQKDEDYKTFSRVRTFPESFRRVEVVVRYGSALQQEFRTVTLIGDPIARITPRFVFTLIGGSASLGAGQAADYRVEMRDGSGHVVQDIVVLWGADPEGTGALIVKPLDSNGRTARVFRHPHATSGQTKLFVRARYRGQEIRGYSDPISVN